MDNTTPTIHQAISKVMTEVGAIGKNQKNAAQGFKFRGIDDVYNSLHGPLTRAGVFIVPDVQNIEVNERETRNGGVARFVVANVKYTVYGPAGDFIIGATVGEAADNGDKAVSKALSVAMKYFLFQLLCIPTQDEDADAQIHELTARKPASAPRQTPATRQAPADDPFLIDSDYNTSAPPAEDFWEGERGHGGDRNAGPADGATDGQLKNIFRLRKKIGLSDEQFSSRMEKAFGVTSDRALSKSQASKVISTLKREAGEDEDK